ncbi:2OG-Fe(II) oxygenase family protein [Cognatishimia sp. D5M38]|uniref:2OG-Fe(II) oxygenase family protein n=1 Tax=Cognatishimia coralii TaxID=3083254 RepID=A0ABU8QL31_9RHOB
MIPISDPPFPNYRGGPVQWGRLNIGDLVQRLTNDVYLANLHRVVNTSGRERYSIPFFIDADYEAEFAPLPSCVSAENPARYEPVTCGRHKFSRFVESFPHLAKEYL